MAEPLAPVDARVTRHPVSHYTISFYKRWARQTKRERPNVARNTPLRYVQLRSIIGH